MLVKTPPPVPAYIVVGVDGSIARDRIGPASVLFVPSIGVGIINGVSEFTDNDGVVMGRFGLGDPLCIEGGKFVLIFRVLFCSTPQDGTHSIRKTDRISNCFFPFLIFTPFYNSILLHIVIIHHSITHPLYSGEGKDRWAIIDGSTIEHRILPPWNTDDSGPPVKTLGAGIVYHQFSDRPSSMVHCPSSGLDRNPRWGIIPTHHTGCDGGK